MARWQRLLAAAICRCTRLHLLRYVVTFLLCLFITSAWSQRFFNLTYKEVQIDSVMPHFGYSVPLGENYRDSIYDVQILYPEFVDATSVDVARYLALRSVGEENLRSVGVEEGRSVDNSLVDGALPELPLIEQTIMASRGKGFLSIGFCPLVYREGRYQWLVSFMLKVTPTPNPSRGEERSPTLTLPRREGSLVSQCKNSALPTGEGGASPLHLDGGGYYASHSVLANGRWAKIRVSESGVFQITEELIRKAGFTDVNKVKVYGYGGNLQPETLTQEYLLQTDDLQEVAQCVTGGRRLFYARGPVSWQSNTATSRARNPYSNYGYYFLTQGEDEPLTISETDFLAACYPLADDYHVLYESDGYAWFQGGRNLYEYTPINSGASKTYTLSPTPALPEGKGGSAKLSVTVSAGVNSVVNVSCNGQDLGTITINVSSTYYEKGHATNRVFNLSDVQDQNNVTLTTKSGGPVRLDFISLTLSDPKPAPNLSTDQFAVPEYVYNITNQDLHGDSAVDMVIIIPASQKLRSQAERLADFHQNHDGLRVRIVPADELYNEFSSGTPDATAYKRYLKMLYDRAETEADRPRFLLLFGDCAWDNRMLTSDWRQASPDDYLLCYESYDSFSETYCYVSDEFFCMLDDGESLTTGSYPNERPAGLADMAVGRFPVTTESDAKVMVDKVISYVSNQNAGAWQNTLVFMGDDGNGNAHMRDINDAAIETNQRHPGYQIKKVMWDAFTRETSSTGNSYPEVSKLVKQYQQQGALIMDYAGHGRADQMSHENVLRLADFQQFSNQNLPLWITASCDIMPYDGSTATIGETAVLNNKGGAIAFYGTSRTVFVAQNKVMNMAFMRHVLTIGDDGKPITIGEAQMLAKNEMITKRLDTSVNMLQYQLLGDPALSLNIPTLTVVVDSINGISASGEGVQMAQLKAGSIARVVGHVVDAADFNGIVAATVRDSEETIVCKLNNTESDGAQTAFTYRDRTKTLYNGNDSVRNGRFQLSFAVPMDINYSDAAGLINLHAVSNDHTLLAHGANDHFIVGGSATAGNDSIGPSIYCYLNSPSFVNGGNVNTTPYFVAQLTDQDGINTTGNGVGHDLELIIDGDMSKTYVLNENFQFDFGSYTTGSTYYNIPELEPGMHTLLFRAWDVLNNSSTAQLSFNVVKGLSPRLFSVSCTQNPARTSTTFIISHDRTGCTVDVELDIFDTSGRQLWRHNESGVSTNGAYTLTWDLTVDGGQRLQTGVYLYRVSISSDGSKQVSKAKKLVVIAP
ncbi:MAG: type IX secretion system sortase PorU [Prevotella sp.]|nr:type IX secretion system sortase PorU [Prevotella sp.]